MNSFDVFVHSSGDSNLSGFLKDPLSINRAAAQRCSSCADACCNIHMRTEHFFLAPLYHKTPDRERERKTSSSVLIRITSSPKSLDKQKKNKELNLMFLFQISKTHEIKSEVFKRENTSSFNNTIHIQCKNTSLIGVITAFIKCHMTNNPNYTFKKIQG